MQFVLPVRRNATRGLALIFGFVLVSLGSLGLAAPAMAEFGFVTKWGTGGSANGQGAPYSVATDAASNVYVTDRDNFRIQKFTSTGNFITKWGSPGSGNGQFSILGGIATDTAGNVYVTDLGNDRIQKFTSNGTFITKWGSEGSGNGQFSFPNGIATDPGGSVYVSEGESDRIQKFTSTGGFVTKWGVFGSNNGQFNSPYGVATDDLGNVYVADSGNLRIQKFGEIPDTSITAQPEAQTIRRGATFRFKATGPGSSSFECELDNGGFDPCVSPKTFRVAIGRHRFEVRATGAAGNTDPTPAIAKWRVLPRN